MKKVSLSFLAFALCYIASAQQPAQQPPTQQPPGSVSNPPSGPAKPNQPATDPANAQAPFMRYPTIPPFHLLKLDSTTYLTKDDVKKNRRTIVMFFSPDCEHCKHQTEAILADFKDFKDIEIVMATYQPFEEMKEFYAHYKISEHANIKIGRDEKFFLAPFYKIRNLPYLALYDKKGNLITTFEGTQKVDTLLNAFAEGHQD